MNILEYYSGIIFQPKTTFERIAGERPLGFSILTYIGISLISMIAGLAFFDPTEELYHAIPIDMADLFIGFTTFGIIAGFFGGILLFFIGAAILHLISALFKGEGDVISLLSVLGFASLPTLVAVPFNVVSSVVGLPFIGSAVGFAAFIWTFVLQVYGLQAVYRFSSGKAVFILLLPFILTVAFIIAAMVLLFVSLGPLLLEMAPSFGHLPM